MDKHSKEIEDLKREVKYLRLELDVIKEYLKTIRKEQIKLESVDGKMLMDAFFGLVGKQK